MMARHVPMRTCVVCREKKPKHELLRIVRTPEGEVLVDASGKLNGRGGYVCTKDHWGEAGLRAKLGHSLHLELTQADIERLSENANQM